MKQKQISGNVLVIGMCISMFLWGLSWPSGKILTQFCSPINFAAYRYIIVVATLLPLLLFMKTGISIKKGAAPSILISGILLAVYSFLFFMGLKKGAAGAGGVLVTTLNPIMAYIIGIIISKRLPLRNEVIGLLLGILAGVILLYSNSKSYSILDGGNIYFLFASFTWALMSKFTSGASKYGSSFVFSFWQYLVTLLCLLPLVDFREFGEVVKIKDTIFWLNLFFSSAIVTTLATTVYFFTTTKLGAEKASSFLFLVPFAAAISSWLFLGEKLLLNTAIGGVLGILAVYFINRKIRLVGK